MIKIKNLSKSYEKKIIDNYSFEFHEGKSYVITGPSGSGKSTLLNLIGMLEEKDRGEIIINGIKNPQIGTKSSQKLLKSTISYMFQNYGLVDNETVLENLNLVNTKNKDLITIQNILKKVDLSGYEGRKISSLSGGEQQRVAIAKVILKNAKIILCDEPTGNLDQKMGDTIINLLLEIIKEDRERILIVVTHNQEYLNLFDERIELNKI